MKLSPKTAPVEPGGLLIRFHNQVGAAVDVTGITSARWYCHGCGDESRPHSLSFVREEANHHAGRCRASYHRL